jgi:hypothetical protein
MNIAEIEKSPWETWQRNQKGLEYRYLLKRLKIIFMRTKNRCV